MKISVKRIILIITISGLAFTPSLAALTEEELDQLILGDGGTELEDNGHGDTVSQPLNDPFDPFGGKESPFAFSGQAEYQSGLSLEDSDSKKNRFYKNQGRIKLKPSYEREGLRAYADIDYYFNSGAETETRKNNSLECVEAYVEGSGILLWKIGKQRFNWGVGDSFQPTDLLDQADLRDSFMRENDDRYTGVYALSLKYLMGDYALEAAFRPVAARSLTPSGFFAVETDDIESAGGTVSARYSDSEVYTELKDISGGLRFGGTSSLFDWHLLYYSGMNRELLYRSTLTNEEGQKYLDIQPVYRRMNAIGADLSFALSKLNIRLEGLYSPDMPALSSISDGDISSALSALSVDSSEAELQSLESRQFYSYSAGFDINLWGNNGTVYAEWMQARYFDEKDIDPLLLTDVLMLRAEDSLFNQSLNLLLGTMIRVSDGGPGIGFKAEAEYDFKTGLTAALGSYLLFSNNDDYFEMLEGKDLAYIQIKYIF